MNVRIATVFAGITRHRGTEARRNTQRTISLCVSGSLWLVITAGLPARAVAQDGTIEQLVATALDRSPEIRAARTAITAAGGQVTQAGLRPNPTFSGSQMLMTGSQHQTLLEVEWPLDLFRRQARVGAAQHEVEATTLSVQDRERLLAALVRGQAGRCCFIKFVPVHFEKQKMRGDVGECGFDFLQEGAYSRRVCFFGEGKLGKNTRLREECDDGFVFF